MVETNGNGTMPSHTPSQRYLSTRGGSYDVSRPAPIPTPPPANPPPDALRGHRPQRPSIRRWSFHPGSHPIPPPQLGAKLAQPPLLLPRLRNPLPLYLPLGNPPFGSKDHHPKILLHLPPPRPDPTTPPPPLQQPPPPRTLPRPHLCFQRRRPSIPRQPL